MNVNVNYYEALNRYTGKTYHDINGIARTEYLEDEKGEHVKFQEANKVLLEAYKAIVDNCVFGNDWGNWCIHCEEQENSCTNMLIHKEDCIVNKARDYINKY